MKYRIKHSQIIAFFVIFSFFIPPSIALGRTKPDVYVEVILDASGSMAGKVEGRRKMEIAKDVVGGIISEFFDEERDDLAFALRIYGHRSPKSEKDCQDSTLEYPFDRLNTERLKGILSQVEPLGYTPIAYSLIQAAKDFPQDKSLRRIVILVTDGIESCEDSPCQAAQKLMKEGAFTSIHVIGFGLTPESMSLLECITQASGGMLLGAQNALELKKAFEQTVSEAVDIGFRVRVTVNYNPTSEATIMLYPDGSDVPVRQRSADLAGRRIIYAPPGLYDLAVREHTTQTLQWERGISGEKGNVVEKSFNFLRGGFLPEVTVNGNPTTEADIYVYRRGENNPIRVRSAEMEGLEVIYLPMGTFDIKVVERTTESKQWWRGVEIGQGDILEHQFDFLRAGFKIEAKINEKHTIEARFDVYRKGEKTPRRRVQAELKQPQVIYVPPGTYDIKTTAFDIQELKWVRGVTVKAGELRGIEANFQLSGFLVGVTLNGRYSGGARIEVYREGESQPIRNIRAGYQGKTKLVLPPGRYNLRAFEFISKQDIWHRGISLTEGQLIEQSFDFQF